MWKYIENMEIETTRENFFEKRTQKKEFKKERISKEDAEIGDRYNKKRSKVESIPGIEGGG